MSGATYSSEAIFNAYADAVARAGGDSADMSSAGTGLSLPAASGTTQPDAASQVGVTPVTPSAAYADGDWTGYAPCGEQNDDGWSPYYVGVTVRVSGGKPVMITNVWGSPTGDDGDKRLTWNASESERYLGWAADGRNSDAGVKAQVNATLSAGGIVSNVDVVSGATFSSTAIARAYAAAIAKSARAAGSQVPDEPVSPSSPSTDTPSQDDDPDSGSQDVPEAEEPEDVDDKDFADGLWTGYAACGEENDDGWSPYYVAVSVETEGGSVRRIADVWGCATGEPSDGALSWDAAESQRYLDWACDGRDRRGVTYVGVLEQARSALDKGPSLGSIDVVSGATFSSRAIVRAYYAAIRKAAEAAGKSYGEPADDDGEMVEGDDPADDDPADDDPAGPSGPDDNGAALTDGDYVGAGWCEDPTYEDDWDPYYVLVRILVRGGAVTKVAEIGGDSEGVVDPSFRFDLYNATYPNRAIKGTAKTKGLLEQMQSRLDAGRDASEVDVVSGATFSSKAIMEGYAHAVEQARG